MSIRQITRDQRDAIKIVESFCHAIAYGGMFSREACLMAADYLRNERFEEDEQEAAYAFLRFIERQTEVEES